MTTLSPALPGGGSPRQIEGPESGSRIPIAAGARWAGSFMGLVDTAIIGRASVDDSRGRWRWARSIIVLGGLGRHGRGPLAGPALGAGDRGRPPGSGVVGARRDARRGRMARLADDRAPRSPSRFCLSRSASRRRWCPRVAGVPRGERPFDLRVRRLSRGGKSFLQAHGETPAGGRGRGPWQHRQRRRLWDVCTGRRRAALLHLKGIGLPRLGALGAGLSSSLGRWSFRRSCWPPRGATGRRRPRLRACLAGHGVSPLACLWAFQLLAEIGAFSLASLLGGPVRIPGGVGPSDRDGARLVHVHGGARRRRGDVGAGGARGGRGGVAETAGADRVRAGGAGDELWRGGVFSRCGRGR